ncbi:hypothetical protein HanPSC8_Chr15g0661251 [Helianthus annuus]|nr:hypothetical protein HanPSC8_Chr15g0661251 [Helianthus annuus]
MYEGGLLEGVVADHDVGGGGQRRCETHRQHRPTRLRLLLNRHRGETDVILVHESVPVDVQSQQCR